MSRTREAYEAWQRFGSKAEAARQLGEPVSTIKSRIAAYQRTDPATQAAQEAIGTDMVPQLIWAKTKNKDGISYSVLLKPDIDKQPDDVLDRIAGRLEKIKPAPVIKRPKKTTSLLRNVLPIFDVHMSMRVGNYGTAECVDRLVTGSTDILGRLPSAECTVIINGGDFTHHDDPSNLTPQSKHPLPVDMEYDDTTDVATDVTANIIEKALTVSDHVIYQPLRGNHDPNTARILRAALKQRYRKNERVTVQTDNIHFFAHRWKNNLICAHHGDVKANQHKDIVLNFAARYHEEWGGTKYREIFLGHLHSILSVDVPGMLVNRIRAISPMDRHANEALWESVSEMTGVSYKDTGGRFDSVTHYFAPTTAY